MLKINRTQSDSGLYSMTPSCHRDTPSLEHQDGHLSPISGCIACHALLTISEDWFIRIVPLQDYHEQVNAARPPQSIGRSVCVGTVMKKR